MRVNNKKEDSERIDLNQRYERRDWSKRLGITEDELITAVRAAGDDAEKVREYLNRPQRKAPHRAG